MQRGKIESAQTYMTENQPTSLHLHFLPFLQGMLYVGSEISLNKDELSLVQNLAEAFSSAYARYEDFNKLELANIKIEKTLVDLKQTQAQLVQSEKMASLGELTAGIAHEIQNPLNFVNNFSEVNKELIEEMEAERSKLKGERDEKCINCFNGASGCFDLFFKCHGKNQVGSAPELSCGQFSLQRGTKICR